MKSVKILFFLCMVLCGVPAVAFGDTIILEDPVIYPDNEENRAYITAALQDAAFFVETVYKGTFELTGSVFDSPAGETAGRGVKKGQADFLLTVHAVNQPDSKVISLNLKRISDEKEAEPVPFLGEWQEGAGDDFGRSIYYMWASIFDFNIGPETKKPVYVDEFPVDMIPKAAMPLENVQLYPYSLAVTHEGNIIIAANSIALQLDRHFRIIDFPGKKLVEEGNYTYAYGTGVTPGGTIYFRPSTGNDIYAIYPGTDRPKRIRTGISGAGPFAVLPDGSAVLVDIAGQRAVLISGKNRLDLDIFPQEYSYVTALCAGPEGNIWVKDTMDKHIRIYSPEGKLLNAIMPLASTADLGGVKGIAVYRNGDFILLSATALMKFTKNGAPLWRLDEIPSPDAQGFAQVMGAGVDSDTGCIYMTDLSGRRIFKLLDRDYAAAEDADLAFEEELIAVNKELEADPYSSGAFTRKAELYEEAGSVEAAMVNWERVLESDPFAYEAEDRLSALEMRLLKNKAEILRGRTLELLATLGPESARKLYSETVQVFEQILFRNPGDSAAERELQGLREEFLRSEGGPAGKKKPIQVVNVQIERLFPSLLQYYRQYPAGSVTIKNTLDTPITEVKASVFIKNFMDFPSETAVIGSMVPGVSAVMELPVQFNRTVFSLEEDLPVQVQVSVHYFAEGEARQVETYKTSTLYRRTALSWDDSAKLAAFIMPNEEIVSRFSHRVVSALDDAPGFRLSSAFLRAATICDALGVYGIDYIEDPSSPITSVLENADVVDTVRFPRTTLYYRSGDCDDSTALACSLLESAGVPTAIMTSPGHVFFAFDTGEPAANAWQYTSGQCEVIIRNDRVWIPVEATILDKGFFAAWKEASRDIRRYGGSGEIEFLSVRESWRTYPSLPLPESALTIIEPAPERVAARRDGSLGEIKSSLYEEVIADILAEMAAADTRSRVKMLNKAGILHARFGEDRRAEESFGEAMKIAPRSVSSYINMANLKLLRDEPREALAFLERGRDVRSSSVMINALLAKTYFQIGEQRKARDFYRIVEERSPETAESLAYIESSGGTARAADAGSTESLFWDIEEE